MQTPAPFGYERATSVEGAIAALQRHGSEARIIAGGHSLLPMMKLRLANPEHLVDINDLAELAYIREEDGEIRIGALTRHVDLLKSELLARRYPLFRDAEEVIADPVVRNRGTIGGSLCQADAAEDLSAVCSAAKAQVVIRGAGGERVVGMEGFHVGPVHDRRRRRRDPHRGPPAACGRAPAARTRRSSAAPATGPSPPRRPRCGWTAATIADVGIALSAVGLTTIHLTRAEELLRGQAPSEELFAQAGEIASEDCSPMADGRGPVDYKRHLAGVLTHRALRRADGPRAGRRRPEHGSHDDRQRRAGHARRRAAPAARALHPRDARPHRHPLGLRHLQLRRVRRADGRPAGQVVHDARGRCATGHEIRTVEALEVDGAARPDPAGLPRAATRCSAGSARRGC